MALTGQQLRQTIDVLGLRVNASDDVLATLAANLQGVNDLQKSIYEQSWADAKARFDAAIGRAADIGALLEAMHTPLQSNGLIPSFVVAQIRSAPVEPGQFAKSPGRVVVVKDGGYVQVPAAAPAYEPFLDEIGKAIGPDTDAVVELGCGWGRNLARLAMNVDASPPVFIGCEQSASGRACTEGVLAKAGKTDSVVRPFDFYDPDLSFLSDYRNVVVFSVAAIEQIAFMPMDFVDRVMAAAANVTLILFEPIGWQMDPAIGAGPVFKVFELANKNAPFSSVMDAHSFLLTNDRLNLNAAVWSIAGCYNQNLAAVIHHAVDRGVARLEKMVPNISGTNLFNPYSLAVLRKI